MPLSVVIDASVLIKAYVPENMSSKAEELLEKMEQGTIRLVAPDLVYPETGNILWKKHRLKELTSAEVKIISDAIAALPLKIEPSKPLFPLAVDLGITYNITVYDALYVSLATVLETRLITADKKLEDALRKTPLKKRVEWLGEV